MLITKTFARTLFASAVVLLATFASTPVRAAQEASPVDVVELTAEQLAPGYAEGRFTVTEVTRAFLDRIAIYEERYNAFISMNPAALADAQALDVELAAGSLRGPLHGVPVVVKDNIDMAGLVTTAGWDGFSSAMGGVDMVPQDDAAVVERLHAAGAVILGKTNLPDFAGHGTRTESSVAGVTLNPYNVDKAPGASSGGTATAVASSFAVLGLGTETGGSIQNPAAAQALVGVKPTYGLVPLEGIVPLSGSYVDVVGPLAKSVMDAALTLDVLAGPTYDDLATFAGAEHIPDSGYVAGLQRGALEGKRFGLVGPGWRERFLPLAPETEARYREAIATVESLGAETVEDPFAGSGFVELWDAREGGSTSAYDMYLYFQQLGPDAPFNTIEGWEALAGRPYPRGRRNGELVPPTRPSAPEAGDAFQGWRTSSRSSDRCSKTTSSTACSFRRPVPPRPTSSRTPSGPTSIRTTGRNCRATSSTISASRSSRCPTDGTTTELPSYSPLSAIAGPRPTFWPGRMI